MSRAPTQIGAKRSIMRTLSEMYLSIFVLFFRITRWKGRMKFITASIGTSAVMLCIAVTFFDIDSNCDWFHMEMNYWVFLAVGLAAYFISNFYLERHGLEFEKHLHSFSRDKRIALYLAAAAIIMVTGIAPTMVGNHSHYTFHLLRQ
jgi:peptidoglycan/LPS O-acetylase OafA/YrhL